MQMQARFCRRDPHDRWTSDDTPTYRIFDGQGGLEHRFQIPLHFVVHSALLRLRIKMAAAIAPKQEDVCKVEPTEGARDPR